MINTNTRRWKLLSVLTKTTISSLSVLLFALPLYCFANDTPLIDTSIADAQVDETNNNDSVNNQDISNTIKPSENSESLELKSENAPSPKPSFTQRIMPVYGNWCGANHPKDMSLADEPIDLLDQACKKHDVCYENQGYLSCSCDNDINQELILGLNENKFGKTEAVYARSFHLYFNGSPCNGDHSTKVAPSRLLHNVVKKASDRTVDVITSLPIIGDKIEEKFSD